MRRTAGNIDEGRVATQPTARREPSTCCVTASARFDAVTSGSTGSFGITAHYGATETNSEEILT